MPGQHAAGYRAAYAAAERQAAAILRAEQPDRWRQLLDDTIASRAIEQFPPPEDLQPYIDQIKTAIHNRIAKDDAEAQ
jgi:hypothetical protein